MWVITSLQKVSLSQCIAMSIFVHFRRGQINADGQLIRERLLSAAASHEIWSTLSAFSLQKSSRVGEQRAWTQKIYFAKRSGMRSIFIGPRLSFLLTGSETCLMWLWWVKIHQRHIRLTITTSQVGPFPVYAVALIILIYLWWCIIHI